MPEVFVSRLRVVVVVVPLFVRERSVVVVVSRLRVVLGVVPVLRFVSGVRTSLLVGVLLPLSGLALELVFVLPGVAGFVSRAGLLVLLTPELFLFSLGVVAAGVVAAFVRGSVVVSFFVSVVLGFLSLLFCALKLSAKNNIADMIISFFMALVFNG